MFKALPFFIQYTPFVNKQHKCLLFSFFFTLLTGCQTTFVPDTQETRQIQTEPEASSSSEIKDLLNAEFILQREGPNQAFNDFYQLALETNSPPLIERLTTIAIASKNDLFIEKSSNLWLSVSPYEKQAYSLKLQLLLKQDRTHEASALLNQALKNDISLHFLPLYLEEHIRNSAIIDSIKSTISKLLPEHQSNQYIQLTEAHIFLLSGDYDNAINIVTQLLENKNTEKSDTLYLVLAFGQKNANQLKDAIKTLQLAYQEFPTNNRFIAPLIDFLMEDNQTQKALKIYNNTSIESSRKLQIGINLMRALLEHNQPQQALNIANNLPEKRMGLSSQVNYLTAFATAEIGNKDEAIRIMSYVTDSLRSNATQQMALWLYDLNKAEEINGMVLDRTLQQNIPEQTQIISRLHQENGNTTLAYELLDLASERFTEYHTLRYKKALLAESLGYWQITEKELKTLLLQDPENAQYLNALGYTLLTRTKRIDEAMKYIEKAYEKSDNDPAIIDSLGWAFFLKGELEQATYYLKKAWNLLPDDEIAAHYGESLWKQNHHQKAIQIWTSALQTTPNSQLLLDTVKRLSPSLLAELQDQHS